MSRRASMPILTLPPVIETTETSISSPIMIDWLGFLVTRSIGADSPTVAQAMTTALGGRAGDGSLQPHRARPDGGRGFAAHPPTDGLIRRYQGAQSRGSASGGPDLEARRRRPAYEADRREAMEQQPTIIDLRRSDSS